MDYQIKILRQSNLPEEVILSDWTNFIDRWKPQNRQDGRYGFSRFYDVLKAKYGNASPLEALIFRFYEMSGYVFAGEYKSVLSLAMDHLPEEDIVACFEEHLAKPTNSSHAVNTFCEECRLDVKREIRLSRTAIEHAIDDPVSVAVDS